MKAILKTLRRGLKNYACCKLLAGLIVWYIFLQLFLTMMEVFQSFLANGHTMLNTAVRSITEVKQHRARIVFPYNHNLVSSSWSIAFRAIRWRLVWTIFLNSYIPNHVFLSIKCCMSYAYSVFTPLPCRWQHGPPTACFLLRWKVKKIK